MSGLLDSVINMAKDALSHSEIFDNLKSQLAAEGIDKIKQIAMEKGLSPEMVDQLESLAKTAVADSADAKEPA